MKIIKTSTYKDIELAMRGKEILEELKRVDITIEEGDIVMALKELDRIAIIARLNNLPFNIGIDCDNELDYDNRIKMKNMNKDKIIDIVHNLKHCIYDEIEEAEKREFNSYMEERVNPSIHSLEHI